MSDAIAGTRAPTSGTAAPGAAGAACLPVEAAVARPRRLSEPDALRRIANLQTGVVVAVAVVALLYLFSEVLLLLFAAVLLACQLVGLSRFIHHRSRLPYAVALALVVITVSGALIAVSYLLGPRLVTEFRSVYGDIQSQLATLWKTTGQQDWIQHGVDKVRAYISNRSGSLAGTAASFVSSTLGNVGSVALIIVGAIYLAIAPQTYRDGTLRLLPARFRPRGGDLCEAQARTLRRWFVGQLLDMAAVGAMAMLGLYLLGVPLFFTLGAIAGVANFVPYLGALVGSVPAIIVALGQGPQQAISVAILFAVVQAIEGNVISPVISKRTVDLPPVLTLFAQTVLGSLFGPFGLILATPVVASSLVLVRMLYMQDVLGDPPEGADHRA